MGTQYTYGRIYVSNTMINWYKNLNAKQLALTTFVVGIDYEMCVSNLALKSYSESASDRVEQCQNEKRMPDWTGV